MPIYHHCEMIDKLSILDFPETRSNKRINRILKPEQLQDILETLFCKRSVKIIRTIARTGKYKQSVPWVHYECQITKKRRATFISFQDLLDGFWLWWESVSVFALSVWATNIVNKVIWSVLSLGTWVYHKDIGKAQLVEKDISKKTGSLRFWLRARGRSYATSPIEIDALIS